MMRRVNIGVKIGAGFLTLVIILLVTGGTSYWIIRNSINQVAIQTPHSTDALLESTQALQAMATDLESHVGRFKI
jgi:CHASE3 domain sensor protein